MCSDGSSAFYMDDLSIICNQLLLLASYFTAQILHTFYTYIYIRIYI